MRIIQAISRGHAHRLPLRAVVLLSALILPLQAQLWNQNLIVNPDAESGSAISGRDQAAIKTVPGWTVSGNFTVGKYDSGDGFHGKSDFGPVDRGSNYFIGGPGGGKGRASQTIDLASGAAEIDAGRVRFYLSGYLGRSSDQDSASTFLKATFKDAAGKVLLEATANGPSKIEERGLAPRATSGFVLTGTRSVEILLDLSNEGQNFNEAGADNVSLVLALESVTGTNLVVNGDGETAPGKDGVIAGQLPVPGWSAYNTPPYIQTMSYQEARVEESAAGPATRAHLFYGNDQSVLRLRQSTDVTLAKDMIDGGGVKYKLSAWLGGQDTDAGQPSVTAEFLNGSGTVLGTQKLGPVTQADRGGKTGLLQRSNEGSVPAGTRVLRVTLEFANIDPTGNPQYADEISLVLTASAAGVSLKSITNAASGVAGAIAPGEVVDLATTGINLSSSVRMQLDSSGLLSKELGGVRVRIGDMTAPLLYVTSSQIRAIVPYALANQSTADVRVEYQGVASGAVTVNVAKTAPGIFTQDGTAKGLGLIYNAGTVLNSKTNAAAAGSTVTIFWTGGGQTNPEGVDGRIETGVLPVPVAEVVVKIGGKTAELVWAGAVPQVWAGLMQAQVKVPAGLSSTEAVPVVITAGGVASPDNAVTMWVK